MLPLPGPCAAARWPPPAQALKWFVYWRLFYLACSELFAFRGGNEWGVVSGGCLALPWPLGCGSCLQHACCPWRRCLSCTRAAPCPAAAGWSCRGCRRQPQRDAGLMSALLLLAPACLPAGAHAVQEEVAQRCASWWQPAVCVAEASASAGRHMLFKKRWHSGTVTCLCCSLTINRLL